MWKRTGLLLLLLGSTSLVFAQPSTLPVNLTDCGTLSPVEIGSPLSITLNGDVNTIDFTVVYDGVTTSGIPAGSFVLPNTVKLGGETSVLIRAHGLDGSTDVYDDVICPLVLVPPINLTDCGSMSAVELGNPLSIVLAGNTGAIDFTVAYDGVTTSGIPAGPFVLPNTVKLGGETSVLIRARGLGGITEITEVYDDMICPLVLDPPINLTDCDTLGPVEIGSPLSIALNGDVNTIDFTVVYDGVTTSGIPAGSFVTPNNVELGSATSILIRARGLGGITEIMEVYDELTCPLGFVAGLIPSAPIPTLDRWGQLALVSFMIVCGFLVVRRRRMPLR